MFKSALCLYFFIFCASSHAVVSCKSYLGFVEAKLRLIEPVERKREFQGVKVFRPGAVKHDEPLNLSFSLLLGLEERDNGRGDFSESLIGLTPEGHIYHLIHLNQNLTIARKLGTDRKYKGFVLTEAGDLIALDLDDKAYLYQMDLWQRFGAHQAYHVKTKSWAFRSASAFLILSKLAFAPRDASFLEAFFVFQGYELFAPAIWAAVRGFSSLYAYESSHFPDAFEPIDWSPESQEPLLEAHLRGFTRGVDFEISNVESYFKDIL